MPPDTDLKGRRIGESLKAEHKIENGGRLDFVRHMIMCRINYYFQEPEVQILFKKKSIPHPLPVQRMNIPRTFI